MEASKPGTRSAKKAPPVLILALLSGTLFSFGHESNRPHRRHPAANIAEALQRHSIVFKGKLIGDSILPILSDTIYPYYHASRRLTFSVDTVYKGYRRDAFILEYFGSADTSEMKSFKFLKGCTYEIGTDKPVPGKYIPMVSPAPDYNSKPYKVQGNTYIRLHRDSYMKPAESDTLCER